MRWRELMPAEEIVLGALAYNMQPLPIYLSLISISLHARLGATKVELPIDRTALCLTEELALRALARSLHC